MAENVLQELEKLAKKEIELYDFVVEHFGGGFEQMETRLEQNGTFQEYGKIHQEYARLAKADNLEALKRACFIQWYVASEPNSLTGIRDLNHHAVNQVFNLIEQLCLKDELDDEFKWMLAYYYQVAEFYIQEPKKFPALIAQSKANYIKKAWPFPENSFLENRGQLSRYWQQITNNRYLPLKK
jgi:hypothetical protein